MTKVHRFIFIFLGQARKSRRVVHGRVGFFNEGRMDLGIEGLAR